MQNNTNRSSKTSIFIGIIAFLAVTFIICSIAGMITKRKDSDRKYADYKENAQSIDVLFLGSSHMLNSINPAQLYAQTGITSYNMGKPGGMVPESYWTYKLACQYGNPKCVVIDLWSLDRDYKYLDVMDGTKDDDEILSSVSLLHANMDTWPLSVTKIQAVCDLISDNEFRAEFLFPFSLYHSRWSTINSDDFIFDSDKVTDNIYVLGSEAREEVYIDHNIYQPDDTSVTLEQETVSTQYLRRLIEECQSAGTEVILTFLPMAESHPQDFQAANYAEQLSDEYGLEFINLLDHNDLSVIDLNTDISDETHPNVFGMYKLTQYMGQILSTRDYLTEHDDSRNYEFFEAASSKWQSDNITQMLDETDLYKTLGYANMLNANVAILIRGDSPALRDTFVCNLITKLSGSDVISQAKDANGPYFLLKEAIVETGERRIYESYGTAQGSDIPTLTGTGEYIGSQDYAAFYVNGDYENNLFDMEDNYYSDLQLFILGADGEVLESKYFTCNW